MTNLESQLCLATGWAERNGDGWLIFYPDGTASVWNNATPDEIEALEAALVAYPVLAAIHRGHADRAKGHRASCASLKPSPCTCGVTP